MPVGRPAPNEAQSETGPNEHMSMKRLEINVVQLK